MGSSIDLAEVVEDELAQIGRDPVGVPHRPVQEVLHPARAGLTGVFGDRPAVLAGQLGEHAVQERGEPSSGLHPGEPGDMVLPSSNGQATGIHHVGLYLGDGRVVHAPQTGSTVRVDERICGAVRPQTSTNPTPARRTELRR